VTGVSHLVASAGRGSPERQALDRVGLWWISAGVAGVRHEPCDRPGAGLGAPEGAAGDGDSARPSIFIDMARLRSASRSHTKPELRRPPLWPRGRPVMRDTN